MRVNGTFSEYVNVVSGVPQGSVMGPPLFVSYIDGLTKVFKTVKCVIFADDTKQFAVAQNLHDCQLIQDDLNNIVSFLDERQLKVAASKCKVLHFGKNNMKYTYFVGQTMLEAVEQIVDLGITITTDFKSSKHCNAIVSRAAQRTNLMHIAFKTKTPEFLLPMYKTYVRPLLEYNSAVCSMESTFDERYS